MQYCVDPDWAPYESIDIDDFKAINDSKGHAVGDAVLKQISSTLHTLARDTDIAELTNELNEKEWFTLADKAMYKAKRKGKNCIQLVQS